MIKLTKRETQCLQWAAKGKTSWEMGQILGISERTANFHINNLLIKFSVHSRQAAIAIALKSGLLDDLELEQNPKNGNINELGNQHQNINNLKDDLKKNHNSDINTAKADITVDVGESFLGREEITIDLIGLRPNQEKITIGLTGLQLNPSKTHSGKDRPETS